MSTTDTAKAEKKIERDNLATISKIIIEYEDHGCLTISILFEYEGGGSAQCGGGYNYGNTRENPIPAFGNTIAAICKIYGSLDDARGKPVEVIREHGMGFNRAAIGFRPLFLKEKHPDFIFADFMPEPSTLNTDD